jgi:hypothetical protein
MRTAIACLLVLLGCSCSQVGGPSGSNRPEAAGRRREQVRQIVFGESTQGVGSEVRGPLTIAQAERELDRRTAEFKRTTRKELDKVIAQLEEALHKVAAQSDEATRKDPAELKLKECLESLHSQITEVEASLGTRSPEWREFRRACEGGDEVYYVKSGPQSWKESCGTEQYALLRQDTIQNTFEIALRK